MASISLTRTTDGTTSNANANLNNNWTALEGAINGGLDATNLAADSVGSSEIAAGAVGSGELAATINVTTSLSENSRRVLSRVTGAIGNGGTGANTTETDLQSQSITGGTLPATGGWQMHITAAGTLTGTNNTKTIKLYVGASAIATILLPAGSQEDWEFDCMVFGTGTSNVQKSVTKSFSGAGGIVPVCKVTDLALDMSVSQTVKTTGTTPNASDEVTSKILAINISAA